MGRLQNSYLVLATLCSLLAPSVLADSAQKPIHDNQHDDIASTEIIGLDSFPSNATGIENHLAGSWYNPKICSHGYCAYGNRQIAGGRGIALVSTTENLHRIKRLEPVLNLPGNNGPSDPKKGPLYEEKDIPGKGLAFVAAQTLKRGDRLMSLTPTLIVHKKFFADVPEEEQAPILAAAVRMLPGPSRERFQDQIRTVNAGANRDIRKVVRRLAFESNLGYKFTTQDSDSERHYVIYPEALLMEHNCRPNTAYYIDIGHVHRTTVARKIEKGEPLTLAYVDPFQSRADRQEIINTWRGTDCKCALCEADKDAIKKSDNRVREILMIEKILRDPESQGVTTDMMARLVELYKAEKLQSRYSDMYELVALNYNNLGYPKRASKYALLSAQAGAVERGADANDIIAMRILAKDPEGHYSYRARVKKDTKGKGKSN